MRLIASGCFLSLGVTGLMRFAAPFALPGMLAVLLLCGLLRAMPLLMPKPEQLPSLATVDIRHGAHHLTLTALIDSGNLLRDPISGNMCVIVDADALRGVLPENVIKSAESKNADTASFPEDIARRIRLIPVGTATGRGMLLAIRADRVYICDKNKKREVNALVALCKLEKNCEGCEALVPSELMI
jgi:sigma-E processing peptidase SpoIIGA